MVSVSVCVGGISQPCSMHVELAGKCMLALIMQLVEVQSNL